MAKPVLLVTRKLPPAIEARAARDYEARLNPQDEPWYSNGAEIARRAAEIGAAGILCAAGDRVDAACISALPASVKAIATFSVGFDHVDLAAAKARAIAVTNTPEVLTEATAQIAVLRMGNKLRARVVALSEPVKLTKYFGKTVEFPLEQTIPVKKGYIIALSVPTWAPALAVNQGGDTSWRASRKKGTCDDTQAQTAYPEGAVPQFYCLYRTARVMYSARVISTP